MHIDQIDNGIFRLLIPFEDITTTVYIYVCHQGVAVIDSAAYPSDVDAYIVPALGEMNISYTDVKYLLLSHCHGDHTGGIHRLSEIFPKAILGTSFAMDLPNRVDLADGMRILGNLHAVYLPGHADHSFGFYDASTKTLLSADCLQLNGIGKYRKGIWDCDLYIDSVNKLKGMNVERIVAAHEYDPLGSIAEGKTAVMRYLNMCIEIAEIRKTECIIKHRSHPCRG